MIYKLVFGIRLLWAYSQVSRLQAGAQGNARRLLKTLKGALFPVPSREEDPGVRKVRALRAELIRSREPVSWVVSGLTEDKGLGGYPVDGGWKVTETIGSMARRSARQHLWCMFLFRLIREFRPRVCLEMGTSLGVSASYQAAALALNGSGRLITIEADPTLASLAAGHLHGLGLENSRVVQGRFQDRLQPFLDETGFVDYVFCDGGKYEDSTLRYFEQLKPHLDARALLVIDDINWSKGMQSAWRAIESDENVEISLDTGAMGICVMGTGDAAPKQSFRISIE